MRPRGLPLALMLAGCGGSSPSDGPPPSTTSTISGVVAGRAFDGVTSAFFIGKPDFAQSLVIYLFEQSIRCSDISAVGWDASHGSGNQVLEMKLGIPTTGGTVPMTFHVRAPNPMGSVAPGEADVNHTGFAAKPATPMETAALAGTIQLLMKTQGQTASGTFDLTFIDSGSLKGSIDASWCPTGVEP